MEDETPSRLRSGQARRPASGDTRPANRPSPMPTPPRPDPGEEMSAPPPELETPMASRLRSLRESRPPESFQEPAPIPEFNQPFDVPKPTLWERIKRFFGGQ
ncbi:MULTISPECIES: hypothetical protein [Chloracidobacterium]|nr:MULTISPECIES: hypothetical protein [Chloracidobacterium]QUV79215.1 hypothetical protein J8C08_02820 [Chloracidobacterium thermophilum]QUV82254.1 hypothetical protein J8C01_02710 [Chloracidobacterium sp. D]